MIEIKIVVTLRKRRECLGRGIRESSGAIKMQNFIEVQATQHLSKPLCALYCL